MTEGYLHTVERLEPELHRVDRDAALASIAISLRRIADVMEGTKDTPCLVEHIAGVIGNLRG